MIEGACHCGEVQWTFDGMPSDSTVCNCTVCRRYGALWAYDFVDERIHVQGNTSLYLRDDEFGGDVEFHFCATCGCVTYWRGAKSMDDGRRRIAVNLRLSDPAAIADIPVDRFDGLDTYTDLPSDGRCVSSYLF